MIKTARKPSSDPAQEKLRQNKALWNKDVSTFINDLINFKKTMNGAPSKFHPEKGNIKEPIPADPATIVGVLANDFQDIAQKGNQIITQQIEYTKSRKRSQPKAPITPGVAPAVPSEVAPPAPDLSKQLAASVDFDLISEGSNPITRFFTRLFNPPVGFGTAADIRRARISMLNACANTHHKLEKFQVLVVKSSKESIIDAHKKLEDASHDWSLVFRAYNIYKNSKSVSAPDKGGEIDTQLKKQDAEDEKTLQEMDKTILKLEADPTALAPIPEPEAAAPNINHLVVLERIKNIVTDYRKYHEFLPPDNSAGGFLNDLDSATDKFIASRGKKLDPNLETYYQKSLEVLNRELGTKASSFKDMAAQLQAKAKQQAKLVQPVPAVAVSPEKVASLHLEKVAQDFLNRWIGKTVHQLSIFDETSPYRLNCYKAVNSIKKQINQVMNVLEKGLDEEQLNPMIRAINSEFLVLRGLMRSLYLSAKV